MIPSWLVYIDEDGKYKSELEYNGTFNRDDLEFIGYKILGNPCFISPKDAIQWVIDNNEKY